MKCDARVCSFNMDTGCVELLLRDAESGIQNMLNAIQAGILTSSTKERLEQLEETKRELEARIAKTTPAIESGKDAC